MAKKPKFEKLSVNMFRRGQLHYATAYDAPAAARIATRYAREGWDVQVQPWQSLGTKRNVLMKAKPFEVPGKKVIAIIEMSPAFKKRLKS